MKSIFVLALVLVLAFAARADDSPVVYPMQRLPIAFSHQKHATRGTSCTSCHPNASTSRSAVDDLLPTEAECKGCHPVDRTCASLRDAARLGEAEACRDKPDKPSAQCITCHPSYTKGGSVERVYLTPPPLEFSHQSHAQNCESCHDMRGVDLATTAQLPSMTSCLSCHKDGGDSDRRCGDCHLTQLGGLMQTRFEFGDLVPASDGLGDTHGPGFSTNHKQEARQTGATCNACHDRSECVDCHQGVVKPMDFHPGDYTLTHAIDARRGTPDCSACHRAESFCVGCHERSGVTTRANSQFDSVTTGRNFHPSGWASKTAGAGNLHAGEARRNITSCASCHREEDCTTCHTAEPGMGNISPHGSGWRGSARCRALDRENRRMCLRCHVTKQELGCDWSAH